MATKSAKPGTLSAGDWISKGDASRARGVSRQAIWDLVHRGRLTTCVIAGRIYVSRSEVMSFKRRPRGPASQYKSRVPKEKKGKRKKKTYDPSKWISLMEAARVMDVTRQVIADLIRRRRLRTLAVANKTLVLRSAVENFKPLQRSPKPKNKRVKKK
jgi:predicted DNA-binding protein YlxM (UPF0122 family)